MCSNSFNENIKFNINELNIPIDENYMLKMIVTIVNKEYNSGILISTTSEQKDINKSFLVKGAVKTVKTPDNSLYVVFGLLIVVIGLFLYNRNKN